MLALIVWLSAAGVPALDLAAAGADLFEGDARLSRPVQLEARHEPLDEVLQRLSERTDVELKAEGEAADLRVTAFVADLPLRQVLTRLAELLHLTWRRKGEGERSVYTLYLSPDDRRAVAAAQAAEWAAFREDIRRLIRALSPGGAATSDPRDRAAQRLLGTGPVRSAALLLAGFPDPLLDAALRGEPVRIPFAQLPARQQELLRQHQKALQDQQKLLDEPPGSRVVEQDGKRFILTPPRDPPLEQLPVELRVDRSRGDGQYASFSLGIGSVRMSFNPAHSLTIDEQLQIPRHFDSRRCALSRPEPLRLPEAGLPWEEALARFARENRLSVLSDAFDVGHDPQGIHPTVWAPAAGAPAEERLDRLCLPYDTTWNATDPLLLFRRRDWHLERERQIPERKARRWRRIAGEQGVYPLVELARMAGLNEAQRMKLDRYAGEEAFRTVMQNQDLLRLYGALRPEQRALADGNGLTIDRLDVAQQKLLPPVLARVRPGPLDLRRSLERLQAREFADERKAWITLVFRDGERRPVSLDRRARPRPDPWSSRAGR